MTNFEIKISALLSKFQSVKSEFECDQDFKNMLGDTIEYLIDMELYLNENDCEACPRNKLYAIEEPNG